MKKVSTFELPKTRFCNEVKNRNECEFARRIRVKIDGEILSLNFNILAFCEGGFFFVRLQRFEHVKLRAPFAVVKHDLHALLVRVVYYERTLQIHRYRQIGRASCRERFYITVVAV